MPLNYSGNKFLILTICGVSSHSHLISCKNAANPIDIRSLFTQEYHVTAVASVSIAPFSSFAQRIFAAWNTEVMQKFINYYAMTFQGIASIFISYLTKARSKITFFAFYNYTSWISVIPKAFSLRLEMFNYFLTYLSRIAPILQPKTKLQWGNYNFLFSKVKILNKITKKPIKSWKL